MVGPDFDAAPRSALGAILAGGRGRRIGGAKPLSELGGRHLIGYPLAALREARLEAVVVAKRDSPLPEVGCAVLREPDLPRHPLCGLTAALRLAGDRAVVVTACDTPFVTGALLAWLADLDGLVIPEVAGRPQPLLGRYEPQHLGPLEDALRQERSLREALADLRPRIVSERQLRRFGDPRRLCFNVNDSRDLELAEQLL